MIDSKDFLARPEFYQWRDHFETKILQRTNPNKHGDLAQWLAITNQLPEVKTKELNFDLDTVTIGKKNELSSEQFKQLHDGLLALSPWRKGPYNIFGVHIDTEWRSDWKWQRLAPHIQNLKNRRVLDVGCGTGYHCWRMLGAGAEYVMGIDPSIRFLVQHRLINSYAQQANFDFLPLGIEDMPTDMPYFDTVFSMGVLYHRRQPLEHLMELSNLMQAGGELILETLIIDEDKLSESDHGILSPKANSLDRYAQMRNVWSIMTVNKILELLEHAGFKKSHCVDQNTTTTAEQRSTEWMAFHSLSNFLDPLDPSKTIEGYPAPKRGIFIAAK